MEKKYKISLRLLTIVLLLIILANWENGPRTKLTHSMEGKVVVITGGSRGVGFETTKDLLRQGAKVIMGIRDTDQAKKAIDSLESNLKSNCFYAHLDLTDYESIKSFSEEIKSKYGKIDILINNAGSCFLHFTLKEGIELTYFTNHIGHFILSCLLLDNFNLEGRIINLVTTKYKRITEKVLGKFTSSSNLDFSFNEKDYSWMKTYVLSKIAGVHLSQYLADYCTRNNTSVKVASAHPGFINNHFFRNIEKNSMIWYVRAIFQAPFRWFLFKDNVMGAQTTLHCCYVDFEKLVNGGFYRDCQSDKIKSIGLLKNAKKLIAFDKELLEKYNIVKGDKNVMKIFE